MSALSEVIAGLRGSNVLGAADALAVRAAVFGGDDAVSRDEAEGLMALDAAASERAPEWRMLFVEAVTEYVLKASTPPGYVDAATAGWLTGQILRDGRVRGDSEMEVLVRVLEMGEVVDPSLVAFTLNAVKDMVIRGEGPLRDGSAQPGRITAGEVALVRRVLYAAAGDDDLGVTRAEAELLFDINDACRGGDNAPSWTELFSKALAASVMTVSGYTPVPQADAARRQAWLEAPEGGAAGIGDFIKGMFSSQGEDDRPTGASGLLASILHPDGDPQARRAAEAAQAAAVRAEETVTDAEAEWLVERIGRDGVFDEAEAALIDFLKRESASLSPKLAGFLNRAADRVGASAPGFGRRGVS